MINSLRSQSDLLLFGWGGELFRNISGWTEHNETTTIALKDLLSNWYLTRAQSAPLIREALPDYDTRIEEEMRLECKYLGLNPDEMSIEDSFLIEMCYRSMADTQIPSFMQLYKYAYLLLFESNALMHRVRCGEKDEARFMLSVCYELYPKIVTIPIFTHQQWKSLDVVTMSLEPLKSTQEKWSDSFVARIIRKCFPEFLKRYIIRPLKRRVIRNYEVKNLAPNCVITSFDKLRDEKYEINMSDVRSSEDTVMWALLLRTLKSLGY